MLNLSDLCDKVTEVLGAATGLKGADSFDEVDSVHADDAPRILVYPQSGIDDKFSATDRSTFKGGVQQEGVIIYADLWAARRSELPQDMKDMTNAVDAVRAELRSQENTPFFGVKQIKSFTWSWTRKVFRSGKEYFMGARFVLDMNIC